MRSIRNTHRSYLGLSGLMFSHFLLKIRHAPIWLQPRRRRLSVHTTRSSLLVVEISSPVPLHAPRHHGVDNCFIPDFLKCFNRCFGFAEAYKGFIFVALPCGGLCAAMFVPEPRITHTVKLRIFKEETVFRMCRGSFLAVSKPPIARVDAFLSMCSNLHKQLIDVDWMVVILQMFARVLNRSACFRYFRRIGSCKKLAHVTFPRTFAEWYRSFANC